MSQSKNANHMTGVCMRKRRVCWTCSRENGSKIMKSGERLQGAKVGRWALEELIYADIE